MIPVLEIFGPTVQGEGMVAGQKTMFVRTAGCDYRCSWCDSAYTWDGSAKQDIVSMTPEGILHRLGEIGADRYNHVTISGGNPALIRHLGRLVTLLHENHCAVGLETQGSVWQDWFLEIDDLTISPKPPSSGMETDFAILDEIIGHLTAHDRIERHTSLKVVVFDDDDFAYACQVHARYPDVPCFLQVGNPDANTGATDQLVSRLLVDYERLVDRVVASPQMNDVRVLPQLHVLVWGNKRGV
ncbi:7-carboxy-7-deazaguanine synthase QueE [Bacillaceae bacterium SIJ1]|uniref:7-carboxy-7-deazaguanine synthase QueE n=1 Tax=Litoribacterium kuwaitense TaxID=1398745 RepID=UPI0013EAD53B|nr:7-carboxy-7-deazaguanine synthase QueE [Litoribacterium kuwaitense]NGP46278.1 7-carboxy-7-deazaguanine synthase QueE [Litoribacterium kuwaitense]